MVLDDGKRLIDKTDGTGEPQMVNVKLLMRLEMEVVIERWI
jgi:hypothetical protein